MPQITLSFAYDTRDNRTSLTDNRNGLVAYTYDSLNRVTSEELSVSGVGPKAKVTLGYDALSRINSLSRTNSGSGGSASITSTGIVPARSRRSRSGTTRAGSWIGASSESFRAGAT